MHAFHIYLIFKVHPVHSFCCNAVILSLTYSMFDAAAVGEISVTTGVWELQTYRRGNRISNCFSEKTNKCGGFVKLKRTTNQIPVRCQLFTTPECNKTY